MAAPHVAGLGAYYLTLLGKKTPAELCGYIQKTATLDAITSIPNGTFNALAFNGNEAAE